MTAPVIASWAASTSLGSTASSLSMSAPSGITSGDLLMIIVGSDDSTDTTQFSINSTSHPGWTKIVEGGGAASDAHVAAFWRVADGSANDGNIFVTAASSDEMFGWYLRITGADTTTPVQNSTSSQGVLGGSNTTFTFSGGWSTDAADTLVIAACAIDGGDTTFGTSSGYTLLDSEWSGTTGNDASGSIAYTTIASSSTIVPSWVHDVGVVDGWCGLKVGIYAGSGVQTVTPTGIASAEAFGTAVLKYTQFLSPSAIASAEAFGTAVVKGANTIDLTGDGIPTAEAFGSPQLNMTIFPAGIVTGEAFGSPTLTYQQFVVTTGIPSAEAFGSATVVPGAVILIPTGIASEEAFGTAIIVQGAVTLHPTGIASEEAFGSATITPAMWYIVPTGIATAEAIGSQTVKGLNTISAAGNIASAEAFGTLTITIPVWYVTPAGIASAEAFGSALVSSTGGTQFITTPGIASAEAFGSGTLLPGGVFVVPTGIASAEAFGTPTRILEPYIISGTGIPSAEAFGSDKVNMFIPIGANGIPSAEAFGTTYITLASILAVGIASEEAFGIPTITGGVVDFAAGNVSRDISRWLTQHTTYKIGDDIR